MIDVPLLHEMLGEAVAAQRSAERRAVEMEGRYDQSVKQTITLIEALRNRKVKLADIETSESGWKVKPRED